MRSVVVVAVVVVAVASVSFMLHSGAGAASHKWATCVCHSHEVLRCWSSAGTRLAEAVSGRGVCGCAPIFPEGISFRPEECRPQGYKIQIAISLTASEYIALTTALREVIPLMEFVRELKAQGFGCQATNFKAHCRTFEGNSGAIRIATVHKTRPRTKHINTAFYHCRSYVNSSDTTLQHADIFTKPQSRLH
jgi:hypothetical protein